MALWFISGPGHFMPPAKPVSRLSREAPASLLNYLYCQELSEACLSDKGWVESLNPPQSGPFSIWQNPSFSSLGRKCPSSTRNCKEWPHVIFFLPFTLPSLYLECIPCPYRGTLPGERLNQSTSPHLTSTSLLSLSWCYNDPVRSGKHRPSAHHCYQPWSDFWDYCGHSWNRWKGNTPKHIHCLKPSSHSWKIFPQA